MSPLPADVAAVLEATDTVEAGQEGGVVEAQDGHVVMGEAEDETGDE